jgi:hypothetical protein
MSHLQIDMSRSNRSIKDLLSGERAAIKDSKWLGVCKCTFNNNSGHTVRKLAPLQVSYGLGLNRLFPCANGGTVDTCIWPLTTAPIIFIGRNRLVGIDELFRASHQMLSSGEVGATEKK